MERRLRLRRKKLRHKFISSQKRAIFASLPLKHKNPSRQPSRVVECILPPSQPLSHACSPLTHFKLHLCAECAGTCCHLVSIEMVQVYCRFQGKADFFTQLKLLNFFHIFGFYLPFRLSRRFPCFLRPVSILCSL